MRALVLALMTLALTANVAAADDGGSDLNVVPYDPGLPGESGVDVVPYDPGLLSGESAVDVVPYDPGLSGESSVDVVPYDPGLPADQATPTSPAPD
jgi:hypothetical protein